MQQQAGHGMAAQPHVVPARTRLLHLPAREDQAVHLSVGFTAAQHEWLRGTAFAARVTPAEILRRELAVTAHRLDGGSVDESQRLGAAVAGAVAGRAGDGGPVRRMTVMVSAAQHEWLRDRAFRLAVPLAAVVRGCVDVARDAGDAPARGGEVRSPRSGPRRRASDLQAAAHMTVGLPRELHRWLRRRAFEERTTMAELMRRYLDEARRRLDATPPAGATGR